MRTSLHGRRRLASPAAPFGGKHVVIPHVCRPNDIVREAAPLLSRLVGDDIEVEVRPRAQRSVFVDRARLLQGIIGIAVHARDSMQAGGRLTISTQDEPAAPGRSRGHVLITITDTGVGVSAEARARLFEPQGTSHPLGWGTGLGLSFVHRIISRFGGTIQVDSTPGRGTTFTIRLPAIDPAPTVPLRGTRAPQALCGRETILLVDDDNRLRDQVALALRDLGYLVLEAPNGHDAIAALERHGAPVHLVLTDVMMPERDGAALMAQFREWYPTLRVLFITGYSEETVARRGVVLSSATFLKKPFVINDLATRIRALLDEPRHGDGFPSSESGQPVPR